VVTENTKKRLSILSNDFDYDGNLDWSTLDTITGPSKGTIVIDTLTGTILYTPSINADIDEFKYRICDNEGLCAEATVMVLVDLDSTIPYNQVTEEDTPDTIDLAPLLAKFNFLETVDSYIGNGGPIVGNWEFINNNTQLVYTPLHDSIGADYYNIQLYFPNSDTADLIVIVDILPVNDAPVAVLDSVTWTTDTDKLIIDFNTILSNDFDVDGDSIFLSQGVIEFGDSLHVVFNSDSTITVTADTILWCDSWFTYEITDPSGESDTGYVFIMPELEGIVAEDDSIEVDENSQITIHELLNDSFKDMQLCTIDTVVILSDPLNGIAASNEQNTIEYRPTDHYYGADSLEYEIVDIWGQTDSAWVLINVIQRNQPPVADPDAVTNDFGESIQIFILENDYDPDPDGYIDTIFTNLVYDNLPSNGTVWFNPDSGYFEYTPIEFTCEADQFSYTIFDNEGDSASTTVSIGLPEEAPLFANNDTVKTWPGVPVEFNVLTNDEGYFLPYINNYTEPEWGSIEQIGDSSFIFNPYADFGSNDSMTYELVSPCGNQTNGKVIFMIEELRVPEIITPNNDTKNDVLIIDGIEYFPNAMLQIFNRYGHVVFQSKGYENNWGGYSNQGSLGGNKPLPTGSYYYTLLYNEGRNKQAGLIYIYR
jgi:gliding motility-associated-like protein